MIKTFRRKKMLKELFLKYQMDTTNEKLFTGITNIVNVKIFSLLKEIKCDNKFREDFISECHYKIIMVAKEKAFSSVDELTDQMVSSYLERSFKSVRTKFIKDYHVYDSHLKLDQMDENGNCLLDSIADSDSDVLDDTLSIEYQFYDLLSKVSRGDRDFLLLFLNNETNKLNSKTAVARKLGISHQAVSKRFNKIRKEIRKRRK
jgi:hypothetical protein